MDYRKLNMSTLNAFKKALEANPGGDLERTLHKLYTTYPQFRSQADNRHSRREVLVALRLDCNRQSPADVAQALLCHLKSTPPLALNGLRVIAPLGDTVVVKMGHALDTDEISLLGYLTENTTTIVAPRPLGLMTAGPIVCMFLQRLPGETLEDVRDLLNSMLQELRKIELPSGAPLGSLSERHICKDARRHIRISTTPIFDEHGFNYFLVHSGTPRASQAFKTWVASMLQTDHRIVLTHGDLNPRNIITWLDASGAWQLGLVDWEMGGFYPEYWEMLKATSTRQATDTSDWWEYLPECILGYDQDVTTDRFLETSLIP
ncbi:kinase-like protein [Amylostereum chailletii]|nr:kinase-like protein [Amylostereum chailletii]